MAGGEDGKRHQFGAFVLEPGNEVLRKGEGALPMRMSAMLAAPPSSEGICPTN